MKCGLMWVAQRTVGSKAHCVQDEKPSIPEKLASVSFMSLAPVIIGRRQEGLLPL